MDIKDSIKPKLKLCYIDRGTYFKSNLVNQDSQSFKFYFTYEIDDVVGEYWDIKPANNIAKPPYEKYVNQTGTLTTSKVDFDLLSENEYFSYMFGADGIMALGWDNTESELPDQRVVFHFGDTIDQVQEKLDKFNISLNLFSI